MNAKKWIRSFVMLGAVAIPVVLSGCSLFSKSVSEPIDPPQTEVIEEQSSETTSMLDSNELAQPYTVYLKDSNGYLAPITLPMALTEGEEVAVKLLEVMVDQGIYSAALPVNFRAMIPQNTEVLDFSLNEETGVATVNFSEPFVNYNGTDERSIVEAITWTLTSLEGINGVIVQVNGEKLNEMPIASYPLEQVLTRDIGINIEFAEGVNISKASPVTLYFSAQTDSNEQYFVPITRMINRPEDKTVAALEQLIQGPLNSKVLNPVILPNVEVTSIEEFDGVVHIDIQDEAYEPGLFVPSEMLHALILSVTENTGEMAVQVRVNGDINIFDENNISYSSPVSKPQHVNALDI